MSLTIQIVGAGDALDQPVHEHLAAMPGRGVVLIDAREEIVGFIHGDDHLLARRPERVGDHQRGDAFPPVRLGVLAVVLADEMRGKPEARRERLDEFALARSRRPVDQNIRSLWRRRLRDGPRMRAARSRNSPRCAKSSQLSEAAAGVPRRSERICGAARCFLRKNVADEIGKLEVVVVVFLDQPEPDEKPVV